VKDHTTIIFLLGVILLTIVLYFHRLHDRIDEQEQFILKIIPVQTEALKRERILNKRLKKAYDYLVETGQIIE